MSDTMLTGLIVCFSFLGFKPPFRCIDGSFTGSAFDGYIRDGDPTGSKIEVQSASYDFGYGLRRFSWGGQVGAEWRAYRHLSVYTDLTCSANSIFKKNFHSISFDMYNLYLTVGFGYRF